MVVAVSFKKTVELLVVPALRPCGSTRHLALDPLLRQSRVHTSRPDHVARGDHPAPLPFVPRAELWHSLPGLRDHKGKYAPAHILPAHSSELLPVQASAYFLFDWAVHCGQGHSRRPALSGRKDRWCLLFAVRWQNPSGCSDKRREIGRTRQSRNQRRRRKAFSIECASAGKYSSPDREDKVVIALKCC